MKVIKTFKLMGGALVAAISISAWAQASDTGAAPAQSSAAPTSHGSSKSARKANRVLGRKVLDALSKADVSTTGINAVAKGGHVTLEGSVLDPALIDKAGQVAKGVPGVTSVKNDLTVREEGQ
ncbi:MAG: BON domain-containing protein [Paraburkholderia sp.]|uniref:BON domain-containing protein n=1 Tax=Paraburkholderia sp. TaxID=1926495 RepID=UPI003C492E33